MENYQTHIVIQSRPQLCSLLYKEQGRSIIILHMVQKPTVLSIYTHSCRVNMIDVLQSTAILKYHN